MKEKIFRKLDALELTESKLILAVSGGADSMSMFDIVSKYFEKKNLNKKNIIIAHYNHKFRQESEDEAKYLKSYFKDFEFYCEENTVKKFDENFLRKQRYDFFQKVCAKLNCENVYLCLGHNLDDRIETMFLNTLRGCDLNGFLNMNFLDEKIIDDKKIKIIRPLIDIPKYQIKNYCEKNNIKFFEDKTNIDVSISKRNLIRNNIISKFNEISNKDKQGNIKFYESMLNFFNSLENIKKNEVILEKIHLSKYREAEFGYKLISKIENVDDLIVLLKKIGIYKNISQNNLNELLSFLKNVNAKYKLFNGVYLFNSHGNTYLIKAEKNFRQKKLAEKIKISKIGVYNFLDFNINVEEKKFIGLEIRTQIDGDVYKSKKLSKQFINKKIPIFWRNFIPIIADGNDVLQLLDITKLKGYL